MKFTPGTRQAQRTTQKQNCWQKSRKKATGMGDTPVSGFIGHWDPNHRGSELHSGAAEEARDHTPEVTTLQGTKTLQ